MKPLILWGAKGHAKVLHELVIQIDYGVVALFDNDPSVSPPLPGISLYYGRAGFAEWQAQWPAETPVFALVAIGGARGAARLEIQRFLAQHMLQPATVVHPAAYVATDVRLGAGSQVLAHATVCADVQTGEAVIVNTAASVDHECRLGHGVHIAPGATLAGCVTVGDYSMVGAGAVILPNLKIGRSVIIGAGAVVTRDVPDGKIAYGNPARVIRATEP